MDAMLAHKPERVPVAGNLKYTEDCKQIKIGEGEWTKISGLTAYRRDILDVREGVAVSFFVIEEDKSPVLYVVRLKIVDKKITEIESMAVHGQKEGMLFETSNLQTVSKAMVSFPEKARLGTREEMIKAFVQNHRRFDSRSGSLLQTDASRHEIRLGVKTNRRASNDG
jgi:hypothetical protein